MRRREFLAASLATSAVAASGIATVRAAAQGVGAPTPDSKPREFYQLRRYGLHNGPQTKLAEAYFGEALIPALGRLGMGPVGAFRVDIGPETPVFYVLIPGASVASLVAVDLLLADDAVFQKAAQPFWSAPATGPAFARVESSLLAAFHGWPRLMSPPGTATKAKRIFQLRTYESPSDGAHVRKVEMFHDGEFELFTRAGFHPVFFGDTLIGPRLPNLTYMLGFSSMEELTAQWNTFVNDPAWKKLSTSPRYSYEEIVSNITNLILSPLAASQI